MTYESIEDSFSGKTIAVVGNATALLDCCFGKQIDEFDVVIRLNRGLPIKHSAQGSKFDLWCFSTAAWVRGELETYPAMQTVWMSPKLRERYDGSFDCAFYPASHWEALRDKLGERPSVGCMAIDMVSKGTPRQVDVFGFDFKKSGTFYEDRVHNGPHDYSREERFVLNLCAQPCWNFIPCEPVRQSR